MHQDQQLLSPIHACWDGIEDALITLLNLLFKHLESSGTHDTLLFLDTSSAFNTIQPHILARKQILILI